VIKITNKKEEFHPLFYEEIKEKFIKSIESTVRPLKKTEKKSLDDHVHTDTAGGSGIWVVTPFHFFDDKGHTAKAKMWRIEWKVKNPDIPVVLSDKAIKDITLIYVGKFDLIKDLSEKGEVRRLKIIQLTAKTFKKTPDKFWRKKPKTCIKQCDECLEYIDVTVKILEEEKLKIIKLKNKKMKELKNKIKI
jgi:hypothetical protein